jgi:hypothetical protein
VTVGQARVAASPYLVRILDAISPVPPSAAAPWPGRAGAVGTSRFMDAAFEVQGTTADGPDNGPVITYMAGLAPVRLAMNPPGGRGVRPRLAAPPVTGAGSWIARGCGRICMTVC